MLACCARSAARSDAGGTRRGTWATLVRARGDGPEVLNALVAESVAYPAFPEILAVLHAAAAGNLSALDRLLAAVGRGEAAPADQLSQGLHESTLCIDLAPPWDPRRPRAEREATITRLAARLPASAFAPFDRATATNNGLTRGCLEWPPTDPPAVPAGDPSGSLPPVPALLFGGERDLSTPLAWAREEAARAPDGRLVAVPAAGHSVQLRARDPDVRRILARFLAGTWPGA